MAFAKPVTEMANPLSRDIDLQPAQGIVDTLKACDREMFSGFSDGQLAYQNLFSDTILDTIFAVSEVVADIFESAEDNLIVLSGCGTSGRLAFLTTRTVNEWLISVGRRSVLDYIIAAGDKALFTSQESQEDDYKAGINSLEQVSFRKKKVLYIGITCGLSAPFVAGQLDYCLQHLEKFTPVLIGFNPETSARRTTIRGWNKTFHDVLAGHLNTARQKKKAFLINPVVGPEAVCGSSRMKGGSATMIILCAIFYPYWQHGSLSSSHSRNCVRNVVRVFQRATEIAYSSSRGLSLVADMAAKSLAHGGRVIYVGEGNAGIMAMIDASECEPTFGVDHSSFRGYITGGYAYLKNKEGDLSALGASHRTSLEDFEREIAPSLDANDLVIAIDSLSEPRSDLLKAVRHSPAKKIVCRLLTVTDDAASDKATVLSSEPQSLVPITDAVSTDGIDIQLTLPVLGQTHVTSDDASKAEWTPGHGILEIYLLQYSAKLFCNSISTCSHILIGKVYTNVMVDLRIRNAKLFERAVDIIEEIGECSRDSARRFLACSITQQDDSHLAPGVADVTVDVISDLIATATDRTKVVPTAIVMALTGFKLPKAAEALSVCSSIRSCIAQQKRA